MKTERQRPARSTAGSDSDSQAGSCSLLALPVEVLYQVLDLLDSDDLVDLLHTSKTMAIAVMQHSAGRLTFNVQGSNLAAIRQLLWAPPSTLKLMLDGISVVIEWEDLMNLLHKALLVSDHHHEQHLQQLTCISEVSIKGFILPELVPAGLSAMCPNLHTLHLHICNIDDDEWGLSSNKTSGHGQSIGSKASSHGRGSSPSTSTGASGLPGVGIATQLRTLILQGVKAPFLGTMDLPAGDARVARSMQPVEQYAEQLKTSLPNLTCLKLFCSPDAVPLISIFGLQLTELHLPSFYSMSELYWWEASPHLQQLQKMVLPDTPLSEPELKKLLCLPSLTHVEYGPLTQCLSEDYSSHPCKWQTLHLHLQNKWQSLDTLAKLPLHSLTHPLKLGSRAEDGVKLLLPATREDGHSHPGLERLAQQLERCGIEVPTPHVWWSCECNDNPEMDNLSLGADHARALTAIAPAFGRPARVTLADIIVDQPILEAIATVYSSSLKELMLEECAFEGNMRPAWHAALSGLPALQRLELIYCYHDMPEGPEGEAARLAKFVRPLAAAMAQQPAGRRLEVVRRDDEDHNSSEEFAKLVTADTEVALMDVEVTAKGDGKEKTCIRIASTHKFGQSAAAH